MSIATAFTAKQCEVGAQNLSMMIDINTNMMLCCTIIASLLHSTHMYTGHGEWVGELLQDRK